MRRATQQAMCRRHASGDVRAAAAGRARALHAGDGRARAQRRARARCGACAVGARARPTR
jgi:hypothetical protein